MKLIVQFAVLGFMPVPWTVPNFGSGTSGSGTKFRFKTRTRKSRPAEMSMSLEDWQKRIKAQATFAMAELELDPVKCPVLLHLLFMMRTPPGKRDGELWFPGVKETEQDNWVKVGRHEPDLTNLIKAVEDPLQGVVYHNDVQVRQHAASMVYSSTPGLRVNVLELFDRDYPGRGDVVVAPKPLRRPRSVRAKRGTNSTQIETTE